ncbi:MAG: MerR family transcriptional regulator [Longimicrobiales bacterium]
MKDEERYTVSQLARLAHVTVRALHHYDEIGLLVPSERGANGYRLYAGQDLERLRQILLFRQFGFGLEKIGGLLNASEDTRLLALEEQRRVLKERQSQTRAVIKAVDRALTELKEGVQMNDKTMFEGFESFDHSKYEEEAKERWGDTDAYKESKRRTKSYSKEDWVKIKAEGESCWERMGHLMDAGNEADSEAAVALAEEHRIHIDRWFYPCSREMHGSLGQMYTADPKFTEYFESRHEGLAEFVRRAIEANGDRA